MKIIDIESTKDPSFNLAIEEYALRHLDPAHSYLLIYINHPSVIIGRNQNLYEEINYGYVKNHNIPVYRRISGGGAVYHDPGNINFSFITDYHSKRLNNYTEFNQPVIQALNSLGIDAYMDDRNAIRVENYKISGNAQFSASGRMFSHGTLLFDANLDRLKKSLKSNIGHIQSSAHKSVRSEIVNIRYLLDRNMKLRAFKDFLLNHISQFKGIQKTYYSLNEADWQNIKHIKNKRYDTWEWNVGKSPRFSLQKHMNFDDGYIDVALEVKKGYIKWISLSSDFTSGPFLHTIEQSLSGCRFTPEDIGEILDEKLSFQEVNEFPNRFISQLFHISPVNEHL